MFNLAIYYLDATSFGVTNPKSKIKNQKSEHAF